MNEIVCSGVTESPFGRITHRWTAAGLYSLDFDPQFSNQVDEATPIADGDDPRAMQLSDLLMRYFEGEEVSFAEVQIDRSGWTDFFATIYDECSQIGYGQTKTYGELASACGRPSAARAVGSAMARNRVPIVIPCHRVMGSTGKLTGFSAPGGVETKRQLLDMESNQQPLLTAGAI